MNLGRFHGAIWSLRTEFQDYDILSHLNKTIAALNQSISQPDAQMAAAFKAQITSLSEILGQCPSNNAPPSRRKAYKELGAEDKIGIGLLNKIKAILSANSITPADALASIQKTDKEVQEFYQTITELSDGLEKIEAEYDELEEGEQEIGISIPESVLKANLSNFEEEIKCINELLTVFSEVATGKVGQYSIRTIGSSDLEIFLKIGAIVGTCVVAAIERIVALYKQQLEIKKVKLELEHLKMPAKVTKPYDEHTKEIVQKEIEVIAKELIKSYYKKKDDGRKNELTTHLSKVLGYMAERIDKGATFEVRVGLPEKPEEPVKPEEENKEAHVEYQKKLKAYEKKNNEALTINQSGRKVAEIEDTSKEILKLPEPYKPEEKPEL